MVDPHVLHVDTRLGRGGEQATQCSRFVRDHHRQHRVVGGGADAAFAGDPRVPRAAPPQQVHNRVQGAGAERGSGRRQVRSDLLQDRGHGAVAGGVAVAERDVLDAGQLTQVQRVEVQLGGPQDTRVEGERTRSADPAASRACRCEGDAVGGSGLEGHRQVDVDEQRTLRRLHAVGLLPALRHVPRTG